ncbi:RNA polymerase sigma-70 factor, ECF subfamily [Actinopolymorpha cephalotaxi]|uniref:RNA polymerase sigma-70 factor (ECF subfamily) n=1 Tax=Actinopolymorpha cephalotaxi TaxID=504797 RepID=A0A1I2XR37_9ACTN|nr:RNA polymerase sigma factor SigJ [Actinopolymorpha cephalotaxi]NYH87144.1 RNA polymerase sigma-70 factor (ECF subfamily) [Actinopolymorpha cephalotaxi]SFH15978.1 RNA polymerase sigma-70 factor, ECF subfamily [Actinopolymorpha cephalotaxi]
MEYDTSARASRTDELAAEFTALRPRLLGVAYSLLGSLDEAEDVVQDAWLRLTRTDPEKVDAIRDLTGWLVVTVSRLGVDALRSARRRREEYVGPWLPEPLVTGDPADRVTLDESMSLAMLVVLESLSPAERTSFVLHDVFGCEFTEVAQAVGRTPAACRQLAARARKHVAARAPRFEVDTEAHRDVVAAFARACEGMDLAALVELLDPDVVLRTDGGGRVLAARRPVVGAEKVARFLVRTARSLGPPRQRHVLVNGRPGLLRYRAGRLDSVVGLTIADGRITELDVVRNPEKLRSIP